MKQYVLSIGNLGNSIHYKTVKYKEIYFDRHGSVEEFSIVMSYSTFGTIR